MGLAEEVGVGLLAVVVHVAVVAAAAVVAADAESVRESRGLLAVTCQYEWECAYGGLHA